MKAPQGFSLVELLAVMAIITVLVAILSPSLRRARRLVRSAVCLSNLHHVGVGHMSYSAGANGLTVPTVSFDRQW